ncbi:hypothetical protein LIER_38562 [Lithospermum erythrorhizon]|uniref:Reverse transcriptase domain-containing protein n=1 Tax=Lithospermum erythrorhizon TaxID=34254 RepID=A0AAV3Q5Q9_LITER
MCLDIEVVVDTPVGGCLIGSHFCKSCMIEIEGQKLKVDLTLLNLKDYDIILRMDWLATHYASFDCREKKVYFVIPGQPKIVHCGSKVVSPPPIVSSIQARGMLTKGCKGYLATFIDTNHGKLRLEDIQIVKEFPDVFLEGLPGLPPDRDIEFSIELVPGIGPISKAPYRIAPEKLKEVKDQLQDMLDTGFIRHSVSPWGAPVLFVRKKDGSMRLCIDYRELNKG